MVTSAELLETATARHRAGDLTEARRLYQQLLDRSSDEVVALFRLGLLELQQGRFDAALTLIERAVAASPHELNFQLGLAQVLTAMQRWEEAAAVYRGVLKLNPRLAEVQLSLGGVLQAQGDYAGAIKAYQAAVQFQPGLADAHNNLGNCHKLLGDLPAAEAAYREALALDANHAGAMSNLATILQSRGQVDPAIELLRRAVTLEAQTVTHAVNLGAALCQQRRFAEAESILRQAVEKDPDNPQAAYNLGVALHGQGRLPQAAGQYHRAVQLRPDYADALNNLGNVSKELGDFTAAATAYQSAMQAQPNFVSAINNLGCLMRTMGRLEEAEAILRRGLASNTNHAALHENLGNVLKDAGELDEAIECYRKALLLDPQNAATHSNLAYSLSFQATNAQVILEECLRWNQRHAAALGPPVANHLNDLSSQRRLRIGYVAPDFRDHCQSLFTVPLLSNHEHSSFEIFCYSSVERPDACTRRICGYADEWREVGALDDAELADLIRRDGIDILVDLTMHMANGRPLVFAQKPAPIQICWLAYPGTTGIAAMDYRLSDPRIDPVDSDQPYSEKTIHLPDSFWCYDPLTDEPAVNELPALSRGYITLGCLNNPCKLTDRTLLMWGNVLRSLPEARLVLLAPPGSHRQPLLRRFAALGIAPERIELVPYRPRAEYLHSYHEIDLGLDTYPYNGHTTSLDSFWMGVPVVTRVGETCAGRAGLSQLFQLDLLEFAAGTDEAFAAVICAAAGNLQRLAELRRTLRPRLSQSPLMDAKRFARNIEAVYRRVWSAYCVAP